MYTFNQKLGHGSPLDSTHGDGLYLDTAYRISRAYIKNLCSTYYSIALVGLLPNTAEHRNTTLHLHQSSLLACRVTPQKCPFTLSVRGVPGTEMTTTTLARSRNVAPVDLLTNSML
jgi:hypothetical protein